MRKLKTSDLFAALRCLKAVGAKDEIEKIAKESNTTADAWGKGFELLWSVFDKATEEDGEKAIYNFLAGPFEMSAKEVEDLPAAEVIKNLKQLAEENDLIGFFGSAGKLTR